MTATSATPASTVSGSLRERVRLDAGWLFALGHAHDYRRDHLHGVAYFSYLAKAGYGDGPAAKKFDDRTWRRLDLPHDWAVELPFAKNAGHSHGYKALGRDFPEHSVGWYRRRFTVDERDLGRRFEIAFDGVFREARVFINGFYLGCEPSGHSSFHFDVTDYLDYGVENVIAVRVDASQEEGWYYEGAGIYRHVWLTRMHPLHVAHDGIFVTSEIDGERAEITVRTEIENSGEAATACELVLRVFDVQGKLAGECREPVADVVPGRTTEHVARLSVAKPHLWSLESPHLYRLETTIVVAGTPVDRIETRFGIRTAVFDPDRGFFLNGRRVQLKGTNNHQDHAGIGTALPDAMHEYRLLRLKSFGCNAYRTSHHPPAPELLDACDRLGILVIDENRSMGSSPRELGELARMIRRDRNHPSIIAWSIGNEEWAIESNVRGARIAKTMRDLAHRLDPTRPVTAGISGGWGKGVSTVVDVMGYNYIAHGSTDEHHARFPWQAGLGTEETTTQGTRGVYQSVPERAHSAPVVNGTSGGNTEVGWRHYAARPYLAGLFYWTGFDYRGESNPFVFPAISSQYGILDTCGFEKDWAYYLKAWWRDEPVLHVMPHWNWPGREGEPIAVSVFTNADEVELLLDGKSVGTQKVERNGHLEWSVPYAAGTLEARARSDAGWTLVQRVETTGPAASLELAVDRPRIAADGHDVAVFTVSARDARDRAVPTADATVCFEIEGPGKIIGVGNGDPSSHEADRYVDTIELIELGALEMRTVEALPPESELGRWLETGGWKALDDAASGVAATQPRIVRATLELGAALDVERARLLLRWFGETQEVYFDGKRIASFAHTEGAPLPEVELTREQLSGGRHRVVIAASGYRDAARCERERQVRPAILRVDRPASGWQRKLFNGLAQVIVQSSGAAGKLVLRATAAGLKGAELGVVAEPVAADREWREDSPS